MENGEKTVLVQLISRQSCNACLNVIKELKQYHESQKGFELQIIDIDKNDPITDGKQSYITPAVWVNDDLWYLGNFDLQQFTRKLSLKRD